MQAAPSSAKSNASATSAAAAKPRSNASNETSSLQDAFDFWGYCFDVLRKDQDDDEALHTLNSLAMQLEDDSLSTAFSDVRTPETGMAIMRFCLEKRLGRTISHNTKASHMIEWNAASVTSGNFSGQSCISKSSQSS